MMRSARLRPGKVVTCHSAATSHDIQLGGRMTGKQHGRKCRTGFIRDTAATNYRQGWVFYEP